MIQMGANETGQNILTHVSPARQFHLSTERACCNFRIHCFGRVNLWKKNMNMKTPSEPLRILALLAQTRQVEKNHEHHESQEKGYVMSQFFGSTQQWLVNFTDSSGWMVSYQEIPRKTVGPLASKFRSAYLHFRT